MICLNKTKEIVREMKAAHSFSKMKKLEGFLRGAEECHE